MNPYQRKFLSLVIVAGLVLMPTSCSDTIDTNEDNALIDDTSEIINSTEIDELDSVLADLVIDTYETYETNDAGRISQPPSLPECVTVQLTTQQNYRELVIDFGNEGCLVRDHLLRGQIVVTYTRDPEAQELLINYVLINFFFNAKGIEANRTILRERSNENGNPMFTHNLDVTVTWPNGMQASRTGTKIREWIEGAGSGLFSDNVYEVTGNWTTTFVNGNTHTYEVIEPLRREVVCIYFVSGSFEVQRTNFGGVFDFGDGGCDNNATFTFNNGQEIPITLN
ncbi:hypothetical protein [Winogradskyella aurantiaca]|uniref:hypothetical protein n=1 Tax=Winogradskyella aurantiaca TaxID=2219558 RepID=UPI000E1DEC55|nr:hypothetical protein [Winogradskyella aurantiaca]